MEEQTLQEEARPMTREEVEQLLSSVTRQLEARIDAAKLAVDQQSAAREEALAEREKTLTEREMSVKTAEALKARGLPEALAEAMAFSEEQSMARALDALESAFRDAVQKGVEERLSGDAPKTAPPKPLSELADNDYYAAISRL